MMDPSTPPNITSTPGTAGIKELRAPAMSGSASTPGGVYAQREAELQMDWIGTGIGEEGGIKSQNSAVVQAKLEKSPTPTTKGLIGSLLCGHLR